MMSRSTTERNPAGFACSQWIDRVGKQYATDGRIRISSDIDNDVVLPIDLFDSVADNLINNALRKESASRIELRLLSSDDIILLSVCDDGEAISAEIEGSLFSKPVSSGSGMGIGLYQSAIMAQAFHYELELSLNEPGRVCFNLYQLLSE